jgi:hypothetical protein
VDVARGQTVRAAQALGLMETLAPKTWPRRPNLEPHLLHYDYGSLTCALVGFAL